MIEMSMLVLFAHAGTFKPLGWVQALPVDLTLLSAAVVLVAVIARASRVRSVPVEYGIVGLFFLAMAPALSNPAASPYASEKALNLFTLTLLAAVAPLVLVTARVAATYALASVGVLGASVAAISVVAGNRTEFTNRLVLGDEGSAPIAVGRLVGLAVIVLLAVALYGSRFRRFALFGVGICGAALVLTLSQGPLLAASLGCMVVLLGGWRLDRRFSLRAITVLTAMSVSAVVAVSFLTAQQGAQIATVGTSEEERLRMWTHVLNESGSSALGRGIGSFAADADFTADYPHNLLLEILFETGWFATLVTLALIVIGLRSAYAESRRSIVGVTTCAVLVATVINAMVSGDVNGNRPMLVFIGVALALRRSSGQSRLQPDTTGDVSGDPDAAVRSS
jgi:O-antigen ligase